jgi:outer membrane protein TolC
VAQVDAQLERARVLQQAGALERVDVMRLESALAEARGLHLEAEAGVAAAGEQLRFAIGLPARWSRATR